MATLHFIVTTAFAAVKWLCLNSRESCDGWYLHALFGWKVHLGVSGCGLRKLTSRPHQRLVGVEATFSVFAWFSSRCCVDITSALSSVNLKGPSHRPVSSSRRHGLSPYLHLRHQDYIIFQLSRFTRCTLSFPIHFVECSGSCFHEQFLHTLRKNSASVHLMRLC